MEGVGEEQGRRSLWDRGDMSPNIYEGHLIKSVLRKIIKIVATRCQILRLKCTKFDFGWGSAPDPTRGAYSAPPDPLAEFKWAYF